MPGVERVGVDDSAVAAPGGVASVTSTFGWVLGQDRHGDGRVKREETSKDTVRRSAFALGSRSGVVILHGVIRPAVDSCGSLPKPGTDPVMLTCSTVWNASTHLD